MCRVRLNRTFIKNMCRVRTCVGLGCMSHLIHFVSGIILLFLFMLIVAIINWLCLWWTHTHTWTHTATHTATHTWTHTESQAVSSGGQERGSDRGEHRGGRRPQRTVTRLSHIPHDYTVQAACYH